MRLQTITIFRYILLSCLTLSSLHNTVIANTNPSGLTGQYSCLMSRNVDAYASNLNGGNGIGIGMIVFIDYPKKTGSLILTSVDKFGTTGANGNQKTDDFTFTEFKSAEVPNTYVITSRFADGSTSDLFSIPVNGGNTILVTSGGKDATKAPWTGVCQKI